MSEAENLLNSMGDISVATVDPTTEEHIVIDSNRNVYVPDSLKRIAVQFDHNIERVSFDCPRYWDGIDMSEMKVYINYRRSDGYVGSYLCENVKTESKYYEFPVYTLVDLDYYKSRYTNVRVEPTGTTTDDDDFSPLLRIWYDDPASEMYDIEGPLVVDRGNPDIMHFDWVISRNVTAAKGSISFLVCVKSTDDEGNELNHWNSELNQEMTVSEGLEADDTIEELYPDVITQLLIRMDTVETDNANTRAYIDSNIEREVNECVTQKITDGEITGVDLNEYVPKSEVPDYENYNSRISNNTGRLDAIDEYIEGSIEPVLDSHDELISDLQDDFNNIADYPIEVGTMPEQVYNDIIHYERWNSGKTVIRFRIHASLPLGYNYARISLIQWPNKLFKNNKPTYIYLSEVMDQSITPFPLTKPHSIVYDIGQEHVYIEMPDTHQFTEDESILIDVCAIGSWK